MADIVGAAKPSAAIAAEFEASVGRVYSYVDIHELDDNSIWMKNVPFTEGDVSVDFSRSERRNLNITLDDSDGSIGYGPDNFWYNKIIKPYRGIVLDNGDTWVIPLGEFIPDLIERPRFPASMKVTCRDRSSILDLDGFAETTTFASGTSVSSVISTIATNGGATNQLFQTFSDTLSEDTTFDQGSSRLQACIELATSINAEFFFDAFGQLVLRPYVDPLTAPIDHSFQTGISGNLVDYTRKSTSNFMRNDIVVQGSSQENALVFARATNTDVNSPTSVPNIGRRLDVIENAFVADNTAAQSIADSRLSVSGLEQFDLDMESITIPWLEAGNAIEAVMPDASPSDPTRYLLSSFTIPLGLGSMNVQAKRVTNVG